VEAEGAGWFMRLGGLARGSKTLQVRSRGSSLVDSCGWLTNPDLVARSVVVVATSSPSVCVSPSVHGSPPVCALPLCQPLPVRSSRVVHWCSCHFLDGVLLACAGSGDSAGLSDPELCRGKERVGKRTVCGRAVVGGWGSVVDCACRSLGVSEEQVRCRGEEWVVEGSRGVWGRGRNWAGSWAVEGSACVDSRHVWRSSSNGHISLGCERYWERRSGWVEWVGGVGGWSGWQIGKCRIEESCREW
jgi:hypothetical protein